MTASRARTKVRASAICFTATKDTALVSGTTKANASVRTPPVSYVNRINLKQLLESLVYDKEWWNQKQWQ